MSELQNLVETYLTSAGYHFLQQREGFLIADRLLGLGGLHDTWLVWVPPKLNLPEDYRRAESGLLGQFSTFIPKYPNSRYFVLTPGVASFTKPFRAEASRLGVTLTVPILFFDSPYKSEVSRDYKSAISSLLEDNQSATRVPQPYVHVTDGNPAGEGDDLYSELLQEISNSHQPCLRVVVGPAGIGKSVLFKAVFHDLYQRFQEHKARRGVFCRPVPLVPAYLRRTTSIRVAQLIDEFLRTDVAAPVPHPTFEWMLCNRYSTWLFDGLDELYTGDPEFFFYLLQLLTYPNSQAQVLICARDSLVTSSTAFAEFLEEFPSGSGQKNVSVYQLKSWEPKSKRIFAWIQLEGRAPKSSDRDSDTVSGFLNWTDSTGSLKSLSGIPYYCALMLEDYKKGKEKEFGTDFALIDHAVTAIIDREIKKGLIRPEIFEPDGLRDWLEETAFHHYSRAFAALSADEIASMALIVLKAGLSQEEQSNVVTSMVQFPLFRRGSEIGTISFEHELICEYLAARFILRKIAADPGWAARSLAGRIDLLGSLMVRFLAAHLLSQQGALQAVADALRGESLFGREFASLLQVLLLADPRRDLVGVQRIILEGRDLSYVQFKDRDLAGVSFRNCKLNGTLFVNCDLRGSHFEGAYLVGTNFLDLEETALHSATFGNLERCQYLVVDNRKIASSNEAAEWVRKVTNTNQELRQPCPAAQQARILFTKFIQVDGSGKRDEMWERDLIRGRRIIGGPTPEECIEAAQRFGYLRLGERPGRMRRAVGEQYGEMVQFVSSLRISDGLRRLLNSLCDRAECEHVPPTLR